MGFLGFPLVVISISLAHRYNDQCNYLKKHFAKTIGIFWLKLLLVFAKKSLVFVKNAISSENRRKS
jgi:hypothetical protein